MLSRFSFSGPKGFLTWVLPGLFIVLILSSCEEPKVQLPRPTGWPRIDLPEHSYQKLDDGNCPFTFEYPSIGKVARKKDDSCWMDLHFERFDCWWHLTYRYLPGSGKDIAQHNEEYRKLVFKHIQKVNQIKEKPLNTPFGSGVMYELYGTVGVPAQVFFTDSTHMVMASFYFDSAVRNDSLAPVIEFMKTDLLHMVESIQWRQ